MGFNSGFKGLNTGINGGVGDVKEIVDLVNEI